MQCNKNMRKNKKKNSLVRNSFLLSFNPNPALELNIRGDVIFANSVAKKTLEKLDLKNLKSYLPKDIKKILKILRLKNQKKKTIEVNILDSVFREDIFYNKKITLFIYLQQILLT